MSEHDMPIGESLTALLDNKANHQLAAEHVSKYFFTSDDVASCVNQRYSQQCRVDADLMGKLQEVGRCVEPINESMGVDPDLPAFKAFLSGATIALEVLDTLAQELGLNPTELRRYWKEDTWFVRLIQPENAASMPPDELYAAIGMGIMHRGQQEYDILPTPYRQLVERLDDTNVISYTHSNVFKASFAFVLSAGMHATNDMLVKTEVDAAASGELDWDGWLDTL